MGGSGGSGYEVDIIGGGPGGPSCSTLSFDAPVASPDPAVVAQISVHDICDVVVAGTPPQVRLLVRPIGVQLGALTERLADLTKCIAEGYEYEAEVISLTPVVRVRVSPRRTN